MTNLSQDTRYAYIKNGDPILQLERIMAAGDNFVTSGPDAFLTDFLKSINGNSLLLIGQEKRKAKCKSRNIKAIVFGEKKNLILKIFTRISNAVSLFLRLLMFRPDRILCGRMGSMLWVSFIAARILSVPVVYSCHNRVFSDKDPWYRRLGGSINIWCIQRSNAVICHGPYLKHQILEIGIPESRILEFDVSFEDFIKKDKQKIIPQYIETIKNKTTILYVGRMESEKGIFDLFEACKNKLLEDPEITLVYAGTGSMMKALETTIEDANAKNKVILLGSVPHSDLVAILSIAKMLVAPTREGFPEGRCMAVMEGLVMGLPVIASDFGPFPFLVKDGVNGLLYHPGNVEELRNRILRLLDDRQLYNSLKRGVVAYRDKLINPRLSFGKAMEQAFVL